MSKKNFLHAKNSTDRRTKNPILTIKGTHILKKALPAVERKDAEFFHKLTSDEMECLIGIFQKLNSRSSKKEISHEGFNQVTQK